MSRHRLVIAPQAAKVIRALHPDLKRSVRSALDALSVDPSVGEPLRGELVGLWRYRVRRFRIVYSLERSARLVRVMAIGPRRSIYEDLAAARRRVPSGSTESRPAAGGQNGLKAASVVLQRRRSARYARFDRR